MLWKIVLLSLLQWIFGVGNNRKRVIELSDIKLSGAPTEIRSFMDIDGYYSYTANVTVNETTGISNIKEGTTDTPAYTLDGRKADSQYKGIIIKGGKKIIK